MTDFALFQPGQAAADLSLLADDIASDDGLYTAVLISLFTDKRVETSELPAGETDQRGWWGDTFNEDGFEMGSKLWLLAREKRRPVVLRRAQEYAEEALAWMKRDGVAKSLKATATFAHGNTIVLSISIQRPNLKWEDPLRFQLNWDAHGTEVA